MGIDWSALVTGVIIGYALMQVAYWITTWPRG